MATPRESAPRLACELCQRRKIKCDRGMPCSKCVEKKVQCVPVTSQRLPRGRGGGRPKKDKDLEARMRKLESLLESLQADGRIPASGSNGQVSAVEEKKESTPKPSYQYLGSAFWTSMKDELNNIQETIEEESPFDDLADDFSTPESSSDSPAQVVDITTGTFIPSTFLQIPPPVLRRELCALYFAHVDPAFKVLHAPSVRAHLEQDLPYLDYQVGSPAVTALDFAIYYAAVNSMNDDQCRAVFGQPRLQVLQQYRTMTEAALAQADYVASNDMTTLQAFVIYLAMLRLEDEYRRCWTLVSLAVRIAHAIGLHTEQRRSRDVFNTEMRRRLWHQLCVLDITLAVELASDPLIFPGTHDTPFPSNIDDSDLIFGQEAPVRSQKRWTDMTCSLVPQQVAADAVEAHVLGTGRWKERQDRIHSMGQKIQSRYLIYCDPSVPLHAFAMAVGKSSVATCLLHALRPTLASASTDTSPLNSEHVLSLAVDALTLWRDMAQNAAMLCWRWTLWAPWHALAVAFASLCLITTGTLADRAWILAEATMQEFAGGTATGQQAKLKRPLEKLAIKARSYRAAAATQESQRQQSQSQIAPAPVEMADLDAMFDLDGMLPPSNQGPWEALESVNTPEGWSTWQDFLNDCSGSMAAEWPS